MLVDTAPEFEGRAKKLERVYRLVYYDVAKLIAELEQGPRPQTEGCQVSVRGMCIKLEYPTLPPESGRAAVFA